MRFLCCLSGVKLRDRIKSEKIRKQWKVEEIIDYIINRNGTKIFLGCQKLDYHAKHCNIDPKEKGIYKDLTVVGKTSSCSCRTANGRRRKDGGHKYNGCDSDF